MSESNAGVKLSFGIIVLNGEPFLSYSLQALYPYAHQIIVVEGACKSAAEVATSDGHSKDGTLDTLYSFKDKHDPDDKLTIVTAEEEGQKDGFWIEKDEMSQAYARRATGDYLWQVDHDEFYKDEDVATVIEMLRNDPSITAISFKSLDFWGAPTCRVESMFHRCVGLTNIHRVFAWGPGYRYTTHRPPTVVDPSGVDQRDIKYVSAEQMARKGIFLYHYEYLFPFQVKNKVSYYSNAVYFRSRGSRHPNEWVDNCYMKLNRPFRVHNSAHWLSWLETYNGSHPKAITDMLRDVSANKHPSVTMRRTDDIERLLRKRMYLLSKSVLNLLMPVVRFVYMDCRFAVKRIAVKLGLWRSIQTLRGRTVDGRRTVRSQDGK